MPRTRKGNRDKYVSGKPLVLTTEHCSTKIWVTHILVKLLEWKFTWPVKKYKNLCESYADGIF